MKLMLKASLAKMLATVDMTSMFMFILEQELTSVVKNQL